MNWGCSVTSGGTYVEKTSSGGNSHSWDSIACPNDPLPVTAAAGNCDAFVELDVPTILGSSPTTTITVVNDYNGTDNADDNYPIGVTTVNWTISDNSGNDTTCVTTVEVKGNSYPSIVCPPDVTGTMDATDCFAIPPTIADPVYTAPCFPVDSLILTFRITGAWDTTGVGMVSSFEFPVGVSTIWYIVTDPDGNSDKLFPERPSL